MDSKQFAERFAIADGIGESGSYLLTADGCYQRHNLKRKDMYLTDKENRMRNWELTNNAEREERSIQHNLWKCFHQLGYKLLDNEGAEDLIQRAINDGHKFIIE